MNIEQTKEALEVMQAFVDGKPCEWRSRGLTIWKEIGTPSWDFVKNEYRIKPVPKEIWVNEFSDGTGLSYDSEKRAEESNKWRGIVRKGVRYREIME